MWRFTILGVLSFSVLGLGLFFLPLTANHSCAPVVPPSIPGMLVQPAASRGVLFINETLLVPHSTWNCSELKTYNPSNDSWIEIYNSQNQPLDLYSAHTNIDSGPNTNTFYFPFGAAIAPHGFLVVFPRMYPNFSTTETAALRLLIGSTVVDEIKVPPMGEDQSYARVPDGGSSWIITSTPTIDSSNLASVIPPTATRTKGEATATARAGVTKSGRGSNRRGIGTSGGRGGNRSGGNGNGGNTTQGQQVDGVQPAWSSLHPAIVATTPPTVIRQVGSIFTPSDNGNLDLPHKLLLTLLVIALAFVLFWCWWLFRPHEAG